MSHHSRFGRSTAVASLVALVALTACDRASGPGNTGPQIDVTNVTAAEVEVEDIMRQPVIVSLQGAPSPAAHAAGEVTTVDALGAAIAAGVEVARTGASRRANAATLSAATLSAPLAAMNASAAAVPVLIPDSVRGRTYARDNAGTLYWNTGATGAPPNGIRVLLYAYDTLTHQFNYASTVGYADYRDSSVNNMGRIIGEIVATGQVVPALRMRWASGSVGTPGSSSFDARDTIAGIARKADKSYTFSVRAHQVGDDGVSDRFTFDFDAAVPSVPATARLHLVEGALISTDSLYMQLSSRGMTVRFTTPVRNPNGTFVPSDTARITVNDNLFAYEIFALGSDSPQYVKPNGAALTSAEREAVTRVQAGMLGMYFLGVLTVLLALLPLASVVSTFEP